MEGGWAQHRPHLHQPYQPTHHAGHTLAARAGHARAPRSCCKDTWQTCIGRPQADCGPRSQWPGRGVPLLSEGSTTEAASPASPVGRDTPRNQPDAAASTHTHTHTQPQMQEGNSAAAAAAREPHFAGREGGKAKMAAPMQRRRRLRGEVFVSQHGLWKHSTSPAKPPTREEL